MNVSGYVESVHSGVYLMSRKKIMRTVVILRAAHNRPLKRHAFRLSNGVVAVQRPGAAPNDYIGWNEANIFQFDEDRFNRLNRLYDSGQKDALRQEWDSSPVAALPI